jgi:hypothetical protein
VSKAFNLGCNPRLKEGVDAKPEGLEESSVILQKVILMCTEDEAAHAQIAPINNK